MADNSYQYEVQNIHGQLQLQQTTQRLDIGPMDSNINPDVYVAPRFIKKNKSAKYEGRRSEEGLQD